MQQVTSTTRQARLRLTEKIGFGVGDLGFNLYWTTAVSFLAAFYTDYFGLQAGAAAGELGDLWLRGDRGAQAIVTGGLAGRLDGSGAGRPGRSQHPPGGAWRRAVPHVAQ